MRTSPSATDVAALVESHGHPAGTVRPLGAGLDHTAYLVGPPVTGGQAAGLVVRFASEPDPVEVEREAGLLAVVAAFSPLPVPRPEFTVPELGCLAYRALPGTPLLEQPRDPALAVPLGTALGRFLGALHAIPAERLAGLVPVDDDPLGDSLAEAVAGYASIADRLPAAARPAVEAFLGTPPPAGPASRSFSHNDLGIEHVLTRGATVTGVIDWTDAAVTDPAHDLGRLLRDLGPAALDAALAEDPGAGPSLRGRARFIARCALLEDLAYGLETGRDAYVRKSLDGLAWLFGS